MERSIFANDRMDDDHRDDVINSDTIKKNNDDNTSDDIAKDDENEDNNMKKISNKSNDRITKDIMIAELVNRFPETLDVLLESGLHCIGCYLSPYETLEQGTVGHGWDEEQLDMLVEELNKAIKGDEDHGLGKDEE